MTDDGESQMNMTVQRPTFEWKWNLNTLVVLLGFAGGLIAWGYQWNEVQSGLVFLRTLEQRVAKIESDNRRLDTMELRISANERAVTSISAGLAGINSTLADVKADARVVREILTRIESRDKLQFLTPDLRPPQRDKASAN